MLVVIFGVVCACMYVNSSYNRLARAIYHALQSIHGYTYEKDLFSSSPLVSPPVCQEVFFNGKFRWRSPRDVIRKALFLFFKSTRGRSPLDFCIPSGDYMCEFNGEEEVVGDASPLDEPSLKRHDCSEHGPISYLFELILVIHANKSNGTNHFV
jgi:hypothetical protein